MEKVMLVGTIKRSEGSDFKNFSKKALGKLQKNEDSSQYEPTANEKASEIIEQAEQKVNASEVMSKLSNEPTTAITTIEETQPTPEPAIVDVPLKPGQAIRKKFMELLSKNIITEEYIFELCSKEGTAQFFGVRYPFLLEYDGTKTIKEQAYINGHSRYTSKPITIGDKQYLITNDIYAKTVPKFMAWTDSLDK